MPKITKTTKTATTADTVTADAPALFPVADTAPAAKAPKRRAPTPTAPTAPAFPADLRRVRLGDLVVATAGSRYADLGLFEAPRAADEDDAALDAVITRDGDVPGLIYAQDVDGVLVVAKGRRRTQRGQTLLGDDHVVTVRVVSGYGTAARTRLEAHAENAIRSPPNPAALARDLLAGQADGIPFEELVTYSGGGVSRCRALLAIAERATPALLDEVERGTIDVTGALRIVEGAASAAVQAAALDLVRTEVVRAIDSTDGKSASLTGSRKGDAVRAPDGTVRVTVAACEEAVVRAATATGETVRRAPKAAKAAPAPAAPTVADLRADVAAGKAISLSDLAHAQHREKAAQAASVAAPVAAPAPRRADLTGSVTSTAQAAHARSLAVAAPATAEQRAFLAGIRAALAYLTTGDRPTGIVAAQHGGTFDAIFPA